MIRFPSDSRAYVPFYPSMEHENMYRTIMFDVKCGFPAFSTNPSLCNAGSIYDNDRKYKIAPPGARWWTNDEREIRLSYRYLLRTPPKTNHPVRAVRTHTRRTPTPHRIDALPLLFEGIYILVRDRYNLVDLPT